MSVYLDSSALVKLLVREPESDDLRAFLEARPTPRITSALARTEVVRAVTPHGVVAAARALLGRMHGVIVTRHILDEAGDVASALSLRSLDAIHLATARSLEAHLEVLVSYDRRMVAGAEALGLPVASPA